MDFFQVLSSEVAGTTRASIHEAGPLYVVFELAVVVGVCVLMAVAALIAPTVWELGSLSAALHKSNQRQRHVAPKRLEGEGASTTKARSDAALGVKMAPKTTEGAAPSPAVANILPAAAAAPAAASVDTGDKHVDLDAALDEFCDEEELMDDAFVTAIATQGSGRHTCMPPASSHSTSAPTHAATDHADGGRKKSDARAGEKGNDADVDAALARRMMSGFAGKPKHAGAPHAVTASGHEKRTHEHHPAHPPAKDSQSAAQLRSEHAGNQPHHRAHPEAQTDAEHTPKRPRADLNIAMPHNHKVAATQPKAEPATKPSVDLDAVFDEFQTTDDVLNEALLDSVVAASS